MSDYKRGDRVTVHDPYYGDVRGVVVEDTSDGSSVLYIEGPRVRGSQVMAWSIDLAVCPERVSP